jgi:hypothetical protein
MSRRSVTWYRPRRSWEAARRTHREWKASNPRTKGDNRTWRRNAMMPVTALTHGAFSCECAH